MAAPPARMRKADSDNTAASAKQPPFQRWVPPAPLSRRGWWILAAVLLVLNFPVLHRLFLRHPPAATVTLPFEDGFDSGPRLTEAYAVSGGHWRVVDGRLLGPGARNSAAWLRAELPETFTVSFETYSPAPAEVQLTFGNGRDPFPAFQLVARASGAWKRERSGTWAKVSNHVLTSGVTHRWHLVRARERLVWAVDGERWADIELRGDLGPRFALGTGEESVFFDALRVVPGATSLPPVAPGIESFSDAFDRAELGGDWRATAPEAVHVSGGTVTLSGALNRPVWLNKPLPDEARIEFTAWTETDGGDLKVEAWGDGRSFHTGPVTAAYRASGYVFVFGGWGNTTSVIARQDEHGRDRVERSDVRVEPGRRYRMVIQRKGGTITWSVDGEKFLELRDRAPLSGENHRYFGFSGWRNPAVFDDLSISRN